MRTTIGILSFLAVGAGAVGVGAVALLGSDTIKDVTVELLGNSSYDCGGVTNSVAGDLTYSGTGSSNGQAALVTGTTQLVAPMSRAMNTGVCSTSTLVARAAKAEGIVFALDGISMVSGQADATFKACAGPATCNVPAQTATSPGLRFSGAITGSYSATSWKDALRLLYFGMKNTDGSVLANRNCASAERTALANSWNALFQNCTQTACTTIQHAYRRNDESGTTDTFVSALGVTSINLVNNQSPFCNTGTNGTGASQVILPDAATLLARRLPPGTNINPTGNRGQYWADQQDADPIRRNCAFTSVSGPQDEVCEAGRDLGLVLPIYEAPESSATLSVNPFPSVECDPGLFICRTAAATSSGGLELCPNGTDPMTPPTRGSLQNSPICGAGSCAVPVHKLANGTLDPQCFNTRANIETGFTSPNYDGRVHNLTIWGLNPSTSAVSNAKVQRNGATVNMVGAFYRIHGTHPFATGGEVCVNGSSATDQIGCLVRAEPCSVGFAGNSAVQGNTYALNVNNVAPTDPCVQNLVNLSPTDPATYPLSRKLYLNSLDGFENLGATSTQLKMAKCFGGGTASTIATGAPPPVGHGGFVPLPGAPFCEDFDETQTGCFVTGSANTNACTGNPSGIPPTP